MAKYPDSGELARPEHVRPFPWRLWMWALVMTGAAAAGGYLAWTYREDNTKAKETVAAAEKSALECQSTATANKKQLDECTASLTGEGTKTKEMETQLGALSKNLNASKEELATLRAQRAEADKRMAEIAKIQEKFAKMVETGQLKVTSRRGNLVLSLPAEVLFASGSAVLSEKGQLAIGAVAFNLQASDMKERRFMVLGHTDDVPLKSAEFADNWELSTGRALNVMRILVKAGMDPKGIIAAGAGEHDPVSKDRAKNRRIEIVLLPALTELPALPASLEGGGPAKK